MGLTRPVYLFPFSKLLQSISVNIDFISYAHRSIRSSAEAVTHFIYLRNVFLFLYYIYFSCNNLCTSILLLLYRWANFVFKKKKKKLLVPVGHKWINNWWRGSGTFVQVQYWHDCIQSKPLLETFNSSFWWCFFFSFFLVVVE